MKCTNEYLPVGSCVYALPNVSSLLKVYMYNLLSFMKWK